MDGDHCYRVGQQGLLVHNASVIPAATAAAATTTPAAGTCDPCTQLMIGVDASGNFFDERKWFPKTVTARDERGSKFTTTQGQIISVDVVDYAIARLKDLSGGTSPDTAAHAWIQCVVGVKKDDAGHVIGDSLGGKGELRYKNIFPQNYSRNRGVQSTFEKNVVKPAVAAKKNVCVVIKLLYVNTTPDYDGRPTKVLYTVYIDGTPQSIAYDNDFPADPFTPVPGRPNYCK